MNNLRLIERRVQLSHSWLKVNQFLMTDNGDIVWRSAQLIRCQ